MIANGTNHMMLSEVIFSEALIISKLGRYELQTQMKLLNGVPCEIGIYSRKKFSSDWRMHLNGKISISVLEMPFQQKLADLKDSATLLPDYNAQTHESRCAEIGLQVRHHHIWLEQVYRCSKGVLVHMRPAQELECRGYVWYAGFIDSCIQSFIPLASAWVEDKPEYAKLFIPVSVDKIVAYRELGLPRWVYVEGNFSEDKHSANLSIALFNEEGGQVGAMVGVRLQHAPESTIKMLLAKESEQGALCYRTEWLPYMVSVADTFEHAQEYWLIVSFPENRYAKAISLALEQAGARVDSKGWGNCTQVTSLEQFTGILFVGAESGDNPALHMQLSRNLLAWSHRLIAEQVAKPRAYFISINSDQILVNSLFSAFAKSLYIEQGRKYPVLEFIGDIPEELTHHMLNLLVQPEIELQLSVRAEGVYKPRVLPYCVQVPVLPFNTDGAYLITGGLGAIGQALTEWLLEQGVRCIHLISRSKPKEVLQAKILAWQVDGKTVEHHAIDVTDKMSLSTLIDDIQKSHRLTGVYHTAGILDDALLTDLTSQQLDNVGAAKVTGAWHLHELTKDFNLKHFVLFSSITALMGNEGQLNYGIANQYLDALARLRQRQGLPAQSIQWGPWLGEGMAASFNSRMTAAGIVPLSAKDNFSILSRLDQNEPVVAIINADWTMLRQYSGIWLESMSNLGDAPVKKIGIWLTALRNMPVEDREYWLLNQLKENLRKVLNSNSEIDPEMNFFDIGIDSLMSMEFINDIRTYCGRPNFPSTLFMEQNNLNKLSSYILERLFGNLNDGIKREPTIELIEKAEIDRSDKFSGHEWYPLSYNQCYYWLARGFAQKWIGCRLVLTGELSIDLLEKAIDFVKKRHDFLRVNIDPWLPRQKLLPFKPYILSVDDVSSISQKEMERKLKNAFVRDIRSASPLADDEKISIKVYLIGKNIWEIQFLAAHIISDGVSIHILINEIFEYYSHLKSGNSVMRIYRESQYWQHIDNELDNEKTIRVQQQAFLNRVDTSSLTWIEKNKIDKSSTNKNRLDDFFYEYKAIENLKAYCRKNNFEFKSGLLALFSVSLCKYLRQDKTTVYTIEHGRDRMSGSAVGTYGRNAYINCGTYKKTKGSNHILCT